MKHLLILALAIATFIHTACAQAPQWQWAREPVSNNWSGGNLAIDPSGNIYMIGAFSSDYIIFGNDTLIFIADSGSFIAPDCVFLVKYDQQGNLLWAKNVGHDGGGYNGIAVDAGGNVYGTAGSGIVKYGPSGNKLWGISSNGANALGICLDPQGNFYVTGWFAGSSVTFGSYVLYDSSGGSNFFIAKYDSSGSVLWAATNHGTAYGDNMGYYISADTAGNVYLTGTFAGDSINIGTTVLYNSEINPNAPNTTVINIFTAKYDSSGHPLWAHGAGGVADNGPSGICTDASGNTYITGMLNGGLIILGNDTFFNPDLYQNFFIAKYNTSGNLVWAKSSLGNGLAYANDIALDDKGYIYITGSYGADTMTLGSMTVTGQNGYNFYAAKTRLLG